LKLATTVKESKSHSDRPPSPSSHFTYPLPADKKGFFIESIMPNFFDSKQMKQIDVVLQWLASLLSVISGVVAVQDVGIPIKLALSILTAVSCFLSLHVSSLLAESSTPATTMDATSKATVQQNVDKILRQAPAATLDATATTQLANNIVDLVAAAPAALGIDESANTNLVANIENRFGQETVLPMDHHANVVTADLARTIVDQQAALTQ
jgi:hypothetical protein